MNARRHLHVVADNDGAPEPRFVMPGPEVGIDAIVEQLYLKYQTFVLRLALRSGGGREAWAEDIAQEVFVALYRLGDDIRQLENPAAWLYRVTTNRCLNRLRSERIRAKTPLRWLFPQAGEGSPSPEAAGMARAELRRVQAIVDAAPPKERIVFYAHFADGIERQALAEMLGHSPSYVSRLLGKVLRRIGASCRVEDFISEIRTQTREEGSHVRPA